MNINGIGSYFLNNYLGPGGGYEVRLLISLFRDLRRLRSPYPALLDNGHIFFLMYTPKFLMPLYFVVGRQVMISHF